MAFGCDAGASRKEKFPPMADVSVIIPCYNGAKFIAATIESVLAQTDPAREVFVIDDGSTDNSAAIVRKYVDRSQAGETPTRVTLIQQANAGESRARNVGIAQAAGEFIAFLDADDLWLADKTARQVEAFRQYPDVAAVHTRIFNFKNDLDDCGRAETEKTKDDPSVEDLITYHWVAPSSAMVRREVLMKNQIRFDESTRHSEDMLFLSDVRLAGRFRLVDQTLTAKRIHDKQQTKNPWHTIYSLEGRIKWCQSRRERLGAELSDRLQMDLGHKLVGFLEDRYWRRHTKELVAMREHVRKVCPDLLNRSFISNQRVYPSWIYRLRDMIGGGQR